MTNATLNIIASDLWGTTFRFLLVLLPIVVPVMLFYAFWVIRFRWVIMKFVDAQKPCLLEIRLPKEITKSPAAMEIFFSHLNQGGAKNWGEAFFDGKTRPWFSCELVSTGGVVRFFIWSSQAKFKNLIETQLYGQYPNLEIFEAEDYTKDFFYDPEKYSMYALQFALSKPDPFPIKTYIDYGLSEDQKEEYKIDPITSVIEYLGSMKKGENAWIQILLQKHEKEGFFHGNLGEPKDLKKEVQTEIDKIKKSTIPEGDDDKVFKFPNPTKGQQAVIAALERSYTKTAYDCMIRGIYIPEKESFNGINIGAMIGSFKQYGSQDLNSFRPGILADVDDWRKDYGRIFPFYQKAIDNEIASIKKNLLYAYKLRSYFQWPYKNYHPPYLFGDKFTKPFVLTTEELATIFHFPSGLVSQTPTLQRVSSKKSEAPSNLPI